MTLNQLFAKVALAQGKKLSGGITCNGLRIQLRHAPGKMPELLVTGDVTLTIKVFDLTTTGVPKLHSLIAATQSNIANKLRGETMEYDRYLSNYDTKANKFNKNTQALYNVRYRINYIVKLEKISRLSQLSGNDFVLAVVDRIGFKTDNLNTSGLTDGKGGPATVVYNDWCKYPNISTHEFFHTLGLGHIKGTSSKKSLMGEVAGTHNNAVSLNELFIMNKYLMANLVDMSNGQYASPTLNTAENLRKFLNNPTNGFKYNKAKFR
ncbi:hypothetical protein OQX63_20455 [Pedobacter sp. PF22-3]|uniref:hypothetical protein n=1 Tax=Pedobacter sp. PF22-3 TaxID=2994467 RepID=UPI002248632C|nr:hypothetical protein [Pedobacter sp. PF22-3]MCX2495878.1 hypothetical protein [Pedobacter sp. PF22-3]